METPKPEYYIGYISKILDKNLYTVEVYIQGLAEGHKAYPYRNEMDEPQLDDTVLVLNLDPEFKSVMFYQKLKEDSFVGFRSNGKFVSIKEDYIMIGTSNSEQEYCSDYDPSEGGVESYVKMSDSGDIEIFSTNDINIKALGNITIQSQGVIKTVGNLQFTSGTLKATGQSNTDGQGPFYCGPNTPPGSEVILS